MTNSNGNKIKINPSAAPASEGRHSNPANTGRREPIQLHPEVQPQPSDDQYIKKEEKTGRKWFANKVANRILIGVTIFLIVLYVGLQIWVHM
jgi:hypothetical protein